jgi:aspartyl-tRNA(Asn)/glutamyl-tRNA(Gln) amidotransferase subunit C
MARVTVETVDHVARLAHLSLTTEERETFARQLDEILAYAESIQALDTRDVEPMSHALTSEVLRDDAPAPELPREQALAAAPDADRGLFRVPKVIGG